jgi:outer membrane protein OmpA-like peptidoglycan-associated protein
MMPISSRKNDPWAIHRKSTAETFWASYSDLMAGLLMIFALTTVITLMDIGQRLSVPTQDVKKWEKVVNDIAADQDLRNIENVVVDDKTGALVIRDETLQFGFDRTDLSEEAKETLRQAVPKYMAIIFKHSDFLKRIYMIEISGHTDREDKGLVNPQRSRERAGAVLKFLLDEPLMAPYRQFLKEKAVTAGYADTRFPKDCKENRCPEARRVEILIRLNETEYLRKFLKIIKQVVQ